MKNIMVLFLALNAILSFGQQDKQGCKETEPAYLNRMQGFFLRNCETSEYKTVEFFYTGTDGKGVRLKKSGEYRHLAYDKDKNNPRKVSGDQIRANYANAVLKIKGNSLSDNNSFFSFNANGNEVFMKIENAVDADDRGYDVFIVEVKEMKQEIEITLREAIEKDGKAALYGILFDVGKSDIKPESVGALQQITGYLDANPGVKIIIVGHTDNTGTYASNIALSKARAESIKNYLVTNGKIVSSRLLSEGVGSLCPVSTNATEEGRKLNRRVEIVKL